MKQGYNPFCFGFLHKPFPEPLKNILTCYDVSHRSTTQYYYTNFKYHLTTLYLLFCLSISLFLWSVTIFFNAIWSKTSINADFNHSFFSTISSPLKSYRIKYQVSLLSTPSLSGCSPFLILLAFLNKLGNFPNKPLIFPKKNSKHLNPHLQKHCPVSAFQMPSNQHHQEHSL